MCTSCRSGAGGLSRVDDGGDERPAAVGVDVGRDAVGRAHLGHAGQFLQFRHQLVRHAVEAQAQQVAAGDGPTSDPGAFPGR